MIESPLELEALARLKQDEDIVESYIENVDKVPIEDKITAMYEEESGSLTPWAIDAIVQKALAKLEGVIATSDVAKAYEVIYEAVSEAAHSEG